MNKITNAIVTH